MPIMSTNFAWKHEYDVKLWRHNSAHQIQMTILCHWMNPPHGNFLRTPLLFSATEHGACHNQNIHWFFFFFFAISVQFLFPVVSFSFLSCNHFHADGLHLPRAQPCSSIPSLSHSSFLLDAQSSPDKKLATTQDRQTLQNSDQKQYCYSYIA